MQCVPEIDAIIAYAGFSLMSALGACNQDATFSKEQ